MGDRHKIKRKQKEEQGTKGKTPPRPSRLAMHLRLLDKYVLRDTNARTTGETQNVDRINRIREQKTHARHGNAAQARARALSSSDTRRPNHPTLPHTAPHHTATHTRHITTTVRAKPNTTDGEHERENAERE